MNNKSTPGFLLLFLVLAIFCSCEDAVDYYLGFNQQPELTIDTFEEGLNIFGLLRPDSAGDYNKSFVFVQQNWPALEAEDFRIIHDVTVTVYLEENGVFVDTFAFPLVPSDSLFGDTLYRPVTEFYPQPGQTYQLICDHPDFPLAEGATTVPSKPEIVENSIAVYADQITFAVTNDSLIKMMDIYVITESDSWPVLRVIPEDSSDTHISINMSNSYLVEKVKIFSYDSKLATYYANSNTSLNFNKYRTSFSTLESGFGVFGSLNFTEIEMGR
jgi:hypothetical protein